MSSYASKDYDSQTLEMKIVTFGRLAVIVLLIYCTVLYLDFARWSILDVVDSRNVGEHWSDVL